MNDSSLTKPAIFFLFMVGRTSAHKIKVWLARETRTIGCYKLAVFEILWVFFVLAYITHPCYSYIIIESTSVHARMMTLLVTQIFIIESISNKCHKQTSSSYHIYIQLSVDNCLGAIVKYSYSLHICTKYMQPLNSPVILSSLMQEMTASQTEGQK